MIKENEKIIKFLDERKGIWTVGLSYMVNNEEKYPIEIAEAYLNIILDEIKEFLKK